MKACTFIDLFCGCGGFSLGMERAGFTNLAAIDFNKEAIATFQKNFPHVPHVLKSDLITFKPDHLAGLLNGEPVDVIVGGPPCQGFSKVRRVDGTNPPRNTSTTASPGRAAGMPVRRLWPT